MTHRAEQVLVAVAAAIETAVQPSGVHVFTHRRFSLAANQDELPAISVDYGEDQPFTDRNNVYIDSRLVVQITGVAQSHDEADLRQLLLELRASAHAAIAADFTFGLDFVITAAYGGAAEPEIDVDGEYVIGALTSTWVVHYRMNYSDPN